jgi:hypothetical protein
MADKDICDFAVTGKAIFLEARFSIYTVSFSSDYPFTQVNSFYFISSARQSFR